MRRTDRHTKNIATVRIRVREMALLYNALDPSPFWDRALDRNAAEFIEGERNMSMDLRHEGQRV